MGCIICTWKTFIENCCTIFQFHHYQSTTFFQSKKKFQTIGQKKLIFFCCMYYIIMQLINEKIWLKQRRNRTIAKEINILKNKSMGELEITSFDSFKFNLINKKPYVKLCVWRLEIQLGKSIVHVDVCKFEEYNYYVSCKVEFKDDQLKEIL
jgi:hypothetical protein